MADSRYDLHYDYATCDKCGQQWQIIDWGCALHRLSCGAVEIPLAERARLDAIAAAHGVEVRWA